jgi:aspartyl-tRNA(Asn)/glutamyl-tRNA(Gln) amidotransferase subunit A
VKQIEGAKATLKNCGAVFKTISLPATDYALAAYYLIACAEASSNLARYDGVKYGIRAKDYDDLIDLYARSRSEGFGDEVKRRIILGTYALSSGYYDAYYLKAQKVRTLIVREYEEAFASCDAILTPTSPTTAFKIGEKTDDPLSMYLSDVYTVPVNIAGLPALSMPCGLDDQGLPVGVQLIGPAFGEQAILDIANAYEKAGGFPDADPAGWEVAG